MNDLALDLDILKKHLFSKIESEKFYIIVCDKNYNISYISNFAQKLFDVDIGDNVADFVDYDICKGFSRVIETKDSTIFYDNIDGIYFSIDVSSCQNQAVLVFTDYNDTLDKKSSFIAFAASQQIREYMAVNECFISEIQNPNLEKTQLSLQSERQAMLKLVEFNAKLENLYHKENLNSESFPTANFSQFLISFVEKVKMQVSGIEIDINVQENIICDFHEYKMVVMLTNLIANALKFGDKEGAINIKLYAKNDKVHLFISNHGIWENNNEVFQDRDLQKLKNSYNFTKPRLGLLISKKIVNEHKGNLYINTENSKTEIYITMPILQSDCSHLKSPVFYDAGNKEISRLIQTLTLYN